MATFVEELIARLSLDTDQQSFKKGERGMEDLAASAVKMGAAIGAAFAAAQGAVVAMVVDYAQNARELTNLSRVAGEGFEAFQLYAAGARTVGVEQDKLADIFKDTNDKIGDFLQTGAGPMADFFENIGPKVGITADMFKDLSGKDALQLYVDGLEKANLSQAEMTFYMEAIASDATLLLPLLKNGGEGFADMAREAREAGSVISETGAASAKAMTDSFTKLRMWITGVKNDIAEELMPSITELIDGARKFIKENKALISSAITGFFKAAAVALKGLVYATGLFLAFKLGVAVIAIAQGVMFLSRAFSIARIAALLFNASVLLIPLLIGLGIAAIAVLADDMYSFFQGGESYIGDFVARWPALGDAIYAVGDALKFVWGYAQDVFDLLGAIVTLDFSGMADAFGRIVDRWKSALTGFIGWIGDNLPDPLKNFLGFASQAASKLGGALSSMPSSGGMLGATPMIAPASAGAAISNSTASTMQDNRQYNITGTDIGEVKRVINEKNAFAAKTIDTGREY